MAAQKKGKINHEEVKAEISKLKSRINHLLGFVPPKVLNGFHKTAVDWKAAAHKAKLQADSLRPTVPKLSAALTSLSQFYGEDA